jgi:hypothetical protein
VCVSYLAPASRIQQLQEQLQAEAAAETAATTAAPPAACAGSSSHTGGDGSSSSSNSGARWCTAHNALLASVLRAFSQLPGCAGLPHDVSVAVDMRRRVPCALAAAPAAAPACAADPHHHQRQQQQPLERAVGNFFASAIAEDCDLQQHSRAQMAQALHAAVQR